MSSLSEDPSSLPSIPSPEAFIRFRLSHIDTVPSYVASEYDVRTSPFYSDDELRIVPTIRIFGATDQGQRVVAQIHGAFPYLYIEYKGQLDADTVNAYIYRLGRDLNRSVGETYTSKYEPKEEPQYIAFIVLCKGTPIYSYSVGYKHYLKIYVVEPRTKSRIGECLRKGAVMATKFEVFEDHIPYMLQFMLDSNLYGCGWVEVAECKLRRPLPEARDSALSSDFTASALTSCSGSFSSRIYDVSTVPDSHLHPLHYGPEKESHCPLEIDLSVSSILNRRLLSPRNLHHDFVEKLHPESITQDKLVYSVKELWDDERHRRVLLGQKGPTVERDDVARDWDRRPSHDPIWKGESAHRLKLNSLARDDLAAFTSQPHLSSTRPSLESFVDDTAKANDVEMYLQAKVRTTFEQVDAIYPDRMRRDEMEHYEYGTWAVRAWGMRPQEEMFPAGSPVPIHAEATCPIIQSDEEDEEDDLDDNDDSTNNQSVASLRNEKNEAPLSKEEEAQRRLARTTEAQDKRARSMYDYDEEEEAENEEDIIADQELVEWDKEANGERELSVDAESEGGKRTRDDSVGESDEGLQQSENDAAYQAMVITDEAAVSVLADLAPSSCSDSGPPPLQRICLNPFTSPDKSLRVRFAGESNPSSPLPNLPIASQPMTMLLKLDDDFRIDSSQPSSYGKAHLKEEMLVETDLGLDDLPSDTFADDYAPTPTLLASAPSLVPAHLRSDFFPTDMVAEPTSIPSSTLSDGSKDAASSFGSAPPSKRVSFQLAGVDARDNSLSMSQHASSSITTESTATTIVGERAMLDSSPLLMSSDDPTIRSADPRLPDYRLSQNSFAWSIPPPSAESLIESIESYHLSQIVYKDPYYGNPVDVPKVAREYGGRRFVLKGDSIKFLASFKHDSPSSRGIGQPVAKRRTGITKWEYAARPPSLRDAREWLKKEGEDSTNRARSTRISSQIDAPTQVNSGFNVISAKGAESAVKERQHLAILAIELHVNTRGGLLPDPSIDAISAVFYCFQSENDGLVSNGREPGRHLGVIAVGDASLAKKLGKLGKIVVEVVDTEMDLLNLLVDRVRTEWDPEIFTGYEVHHSSWGYLVERAQSAYGWLIGDELGRIRRSKPTAAATSASDRWGFNQSTTLNFTGRHVLPIWRILKEDAKLQQYTFEHVVYHVLRQRTPHFSFETLTEWYSSGVPRKMAQVFMYWRNRVEMDLELIDEGEIISQTCEFARVFGVDFKSVRTRGSQFKVESVMSRIAKPESFLLLSPNRDQLGKQNAAECIPLIMEPKSAFYKGPLLVLDFQSLYPSVMIAYNYCYSTCLGRIGQFKGTNKLGISSTNLAPGVLHLLQNDLNISPNGFMFVKPEIRKSLLAKMLSELLETRVMVKSSMKGVKEDKALLKLMNARQLGLKLLANVTYGYTSATFSGRMPCVEIADAIVQTGRETLERALETIRSTSKWGAEVVYGDTDSLFVYLPGKSKVDAFRIGQEIADVVTSQNPRPIKLKFEKVYLPCVLLAKKRYVGFKYEHLDDVEPEFDAKGIETVRRDGIPAVQKMQEHCLKLLFRTQDLSLVKAYCQAQWKRLMLGNVSAQDFTFAKEVKMGSYAKGGVPPPGAAISARKMKLDSRAEPEYGERVPYLIMASEAGLRQVNRAITPAEFLADPRIRLDVAYYIKHTMIPPLQRIFNLVGADVEAWYAEMPKFNRLIKRLPAATTTAAERKRVLLDEHFQTDRCCACEGQLDGAGRLCVACLLNPTATVYALQARSRAVQVRSRGVNAVCASCTSTPAAEGAQCDSLDCSVLYARKRIEGQMDEVRELALELGRL